MHRPCRVGRAAAAPRVCQVPNARRAEHWTAHTRGSSACRRCRSSHDARPLGSEGRASRGRKTARSGVNAPGFLHAQKRARASWGYYSPRHERGPRRGHQRALSDLVRAGARHGLSSGETRTRTSNRTLARARAAQNPCRLAESRSETGRQSRHPRVRGTPAERLGPVRGYSPASPIVRYARGGLDPLEYADQRAALARGDLAELAVRANTPRSWSSAKRRSQRTRERLGAVSDEQHAPHLEFVDRHSPEATRRGVPGARRAGARRAGCISNARSIYAPDCAHRVMTVYS